MYLYFPHTPGSITCGALPMAIGVQSDMCTPALARFGTHELKQQFLAPTIAGDYVGCLGVSEVEAGSDVAGIRTNAVKDGGKKELLYTITIIAKTEFELLYKICRQGSSTNFLSSFAKECQN